MFAMYRGDNQDADFKHLHVYKRIDKCEKWAEIRRAIDKAKETYKPDATTPGASDGQPDGHKLAKKRKAPTRQPRKCGSPSSIASPTPRPGPSYAKRRPRRGGRR